jgi:Concanavalin A-like lectin/glucanases superfamily
MDAAVQNGMVPNGRQITESVNNAGDYVRDQMNSVRESVSGSLNQFSSPTAVGTTATEFLNSNSIIAKFTFFVLVLIVFTVIVSLGIQLMGYLMSPANSPYVVYGLLNGNDGLIVSQDPKSKTSIPILKSNNQTTGAEFTWSVWLNLNSNTSNVASLGQKQNVFNKGNSQYGATGVATVNNAPGLYLKQPDGDNETTLHIVMDTMDPNNPSQVIDVTEIPYHKWVHVVIRLENKMMDVYVNGTISKRLTFTASPKQNFNDVNICQNGGFSGQMSNLRYYNYALSAFEINGITMYGPNTTVSKLSSTAAKSSPYFLANTWYTSKYAT